MNVVAPLQALSDLLCHELPAGGAGLLHIADSCPSAPCCTLLSMSLRPACPCARVLCGSLQCCSSPVQLGQYSLPGLSWHVTAARVYADYPCSFCKRLPLPEEVVQACIHMCRSQDLYSGTLHWCAALTQPGCWLLTLIFSACTFSQPCTANAYAWPRRSCRPPHVPQPGPLQRHPALVRCPARCSAEDYAARATCGCNRKLRHTHDTLNLTAALAKAFRADQRQHSSAWHRRGTALPLWMSIRARCPRVRSCTSPARRLRLMPSCIAGRHRSTEPLLWPRKAQACTWPCSTHLLSCTRTLPSCARSW